MIWFKRILIVFATLILLWGIGFVGFTLLVLNLQPQNLDAGSDAIIVPTGGKNRIETGFNLLSAGLAPNLFITGVSHEYPLENMIEKWRKSDFRRGYLPACCIEAGDQARTTEGNALEAKEWAAKNDIQVIRLVTSKYHMPRAYFEFSAQMPDKTILSHVVTSDDLGPDHPFFWEVVFSEYHKNIYRRLQILIGF